MSVDGNARCLYVATWGVPFVFLAADDCVADVGTIVEREEESASAVAAIYGFVGKEIGGVFRRGVGAVVVVPEVGVAGVDGIGLDNAMIENQVEVNDTVASARG